MPTGCLAYSFLPCRLWYRRVAVPLAAQVTRPLTVQHEISRTQGHVLSRMICMLDCMNSNLLYVQRVYKDVCRLVTRQRDCATRVQPHATSIYSRFYCHAAAQDYAGVAHPRLGRVCWLCTELHNTKVPRWSSTSIPRSALQVPTASMKRTL